MDNILIHFYFKASYYELPIYCERRRRGVFSGHRKLLVGMVLLFLIFGFVASKGFGLFGRGKCFNLTVAFQLLIKHDSFITVEIIFCYFKALLMDSNVN